MSFNFNLSAKDQTSVLFISQVKKKLIAKAIEKKISQKAVADKIGVDRSFITRILKGKTNITLRTLAEISWALGVEPELRLIEEDKNASYNYFMDKSKNCQKSTCNFEVNI